MQLVMHVVLTLQSLRLSAPYNVFRTPSRLNTRPSFLVASTMKPRAGQKRPHGTVAIFLAHRMGRMRPKRWAER